MTNTSLLWQGQRLELCPERAIYLPDAACLLVADFHLGKAHSYRRLGVPVPEATTAQQLARLTALLQRCPVHTVVFLGDFLHAASVQHSPALAEFARWRQGHARLNLRLVRGNHDDRAGDPPPSLGMDLADEPLDWAGWWLCHHPPADDEPHPPSRPPMLCGHLHPGVVLRGPGGDRLRLPCFAMSESTVLLPAFGEFTGLHPLPARPGWRRWACAGQRVVAVD